MATTPARALRPFGAPALLAVGAVSGLIVWYAAFPSMYYLGWLPALAGLFLVAGTTPLAHALVGLAYARLRHETIRLELDGAASVAATTAAVVALVALQVPLHVHFALAREGAEARLAAHRAAHVPTGWVGAYQVTRVGRDHCDTDGRTVLWIANDPDSALVHAPGGIDGLCYNHGAAGPLGGDWYWLHED